MPPLFYIREHYNLLSKQPNYTCGLFFFDLMFTVVSQARAIMSISKKAWTFPSRPYYNTLYFQKLIESPTIRRKEERDIPGPRDNLERKSCLAGFFLVLEALGGGGTYWAPGQPRVRKSCLAGCSLTPWPRHGLGASRRLPTQKGQNL